MAVIAQLVSAPKFDAALLIDDHPLFCDALAMTLQAVGEIPTVHTACALQEGLDLLCDGVDVDLVVLDLNLPDVQGLDGLARLRGVTACPILVVSSLFDNRIISSVIHAGARGFIPKHSRRDVFQTALRRIAQGEVFLPDGCVLLEEGAQQADEVVSRLALLTTQQARILALVCAGKLNKQIAFELSIAETTVKAHITAILRKLGVQSRTQAVLAAKQADFANILPNQTPHA